MTPFGRPSNPYSDAPRNSFGRLRTGCVRTPPLYPPHVRRRPKGFEPPPSVGRGPGRGLCRDNAKENPSPAWNLIARAIPVTTPANLRRTNRGYPRDARDLSQAQFRGTYSLTLGFIWRRRWNSRPRSDQGGCNYVCSEDCQATDEDSGKIRLAVWCTRALP